VLPDDPAVTLVGLTVIVPAPFAAFGAVMLNELLVAPVRPLLDAASV
jgi:hypothetical protein